MFTDTKSIAQHLDTHCDAHYTAVELCPSSNKRPDFQGIEDHPALEAVWAIYFEYSPHPEEEVVALFERMASFKHLRNVRELNLNAWQLGDECFELISRSAYAESLRLIRSECMSFTSDGLNTLLNARSLRNLEGLELRDAQGESEPFYIDEQEKSGAKFKALSFCDMELEDADVTILTSMLADEMEYFQLYGNRPFFDGEFLKHMKKIKRLPSLCLGDRRFESAHVQDILESDYAEGLQDLLLGLRDDHATRRLAESSLRSLSTLSIHGEQLTHLSASHLARSPVMDSVTFLLLTTGRSGDDGFIELMEMTRQTRRRALRLGGCGLSDRFVDHITANKERVFHNLSELWIDNNPISESAYARLMESCSDYSGSKPDFWINNDRLSSAFLSKFYSVFRAA